MTRQKKVKHLPGKILEMRANGCVMYFFSDEDNNTSNLKHLHKGNLFMILDTVKSEDVPGEAWQKSNPQEKWCRVWHFKSNLIGYIALEDIIVFTEETRWLT